MQSGGNFGEGDDGSDEKEISVMAMMEKTMGQSG
jgi:hypothetical protein